MNSTVLVLNAGSSSLKWSLLNEAEDRLAGGTLVWSTADTEGMRSQLQAVLWQAEGVAAVGHRMVHGGAHFRRAVLIDDRVRNQLEELIVLAPEHMPAALIGVDTVRAHAPNLPQLASFDTAFHATLPEAAASYGLPHAWCERWGLRRFGFHGLSVEYAVQQARRLLGRLPSRIIVCHLGSGNSLTAVREGRSLDTTMGFTPLEGPLMATRCGSVDPGLLLYLQQHCGIPTDELSTALNQHSGLLGLSGVSGDLREVLASSEAGSSRATRAYECFVWSLRRALGAMLGVLGGVDAVVFTGGVGEHSHRVRYDTCAALQCVGVSLREEENAEPADCLLSTANSRAKVLLIHAREDLIIARELRKVLRGNSQP